MDILIVGSGGREHALTWKLKQSPKVKTIYVAPGNGGTAQIAQNIFAQTTDEVITWLKQNLVDLVVIGPDSSLAEGIVDKIQNMGIKVFGPTKDAAEIESSKAFAKQFMLEENIPTAKFKTFTSFEEASKYIKTQSYPLVIKASGLALGKGVMIAQDEATASQALNEIMNSKIFGDAGHEVVIEEYLTGIEISVHAFCDGKTFKLFPTAQDHKRIFENNTGPNTGGMGTIAPVPNITELQLQEIQDKIIFPTLNALDKKGRTFKGILFPGIMLTDDGPKVIEFNARFGDPETQVYMRLLQSDLLDLLLACVDGTLDQHEPLWSKQSACCVIFASKGYPGDYEKGKEITINSGSLNPGTVIFHAGTKLEANKLVTTGGRVIGVSNVGENLGEAIDKTYEAAKDVSFEGLQYRNDIGKSFTK